MATYTSVDICNSALIKIGADTITTIADDNKRANLCNERYKHCRDEVLRSHNWDCATLKVKLVFDKATISGATAATPPVITATAHGYVSGNKIEIGGDVEDVVGMTELNDNEYWITWTSADTFSLQDTDGDDIVGAGYTAYASGGEARRIPLTDDWDYQYALPTDWLKTIDVLDESGAAISYRKEGLYILTNEDESWLEYIKQETDVDVFDSMLFETIACRLAMDIAYPITNSRQMEEKMEKRYLYQLAEARTINANEDNSDDTDTNAWITARG